nr:PEP-utilizing enzyme [Actinomycetota bacterium]
MDVTSKLVGVAASEGVAVGPVFVHSPGDLKPERETIPEGTADAEIEHFQRSVEAVVPKLSETAEKMREAGNDNEAAIFDAHIELAQDPELAEGVAERVRNLESPEVAVLAVGEEYAEMFAGMEDAYMAARADDVRDVARQISSEIMGESSSGLEALDRPSVVLAHGLAPSDTARVPKGMALGFVTAEGSKTSHVSIM